MEIKCTAKELMIFRKVTKAAEGLGLETYLIGGFVRDKLLGRATKDADLVCAGDAIALAAAVARQFVPSPQVNYYKNFGTAHIRLASAATQELGGDREETFDLEFVGARKESYQSHSRKPDVVPGTIKDDQERRDFTINALAVSLNKNDHGKLIDPFGGVQDLKKQIIRTPLEPA